MPLRWLTHTSRPDFLIADADVLFIDQLLFLPSRRVPVSPWLLSLHKFDTGQETDALLLQRRRALFDYLPRRQTTYTPLLSSQPMRASGGYERSVHFLECQARCPSVHPDQARLGFHHYDPQGHRLVF